MNLEVKELTKSFGDITALENVSFSLDDGDFVFITGPSGAGKTTLLRLILREYLPDYGEILLDKQDITKLKPAEIPVLRRKIGVVFQDFKVLRDRTLRENVEIALAVIGLPMEKWKARVDHVLDLVSLSDRHLLFPSQLSGGELQRVSLARALAVNPEIILADEPTGNLDWDTANQLMELFEKINQEGKTIIMATHHQLIVDRLGKRQIKLDKGKMAGQKTRKRSEKKTKKEIKLDQVKGKKKKPKHVKVKVN